MKDKRVKANRLSAQRSRQRKLEKEAQLTQDVEKLNREVALEQHKEHRLINEENGELPGVSIVCRVHLPSRTPFLRGLQQGEGARL